MGTIGSDKGSVLYLVRQKPIESDGCQQYNLLLDKKFDKCLTTEELVLRSPEFIIAKASPLIMFRNKF